MNYAAKSLRLRNFLHKSYLYENKLKNEDDPKNEDNFKTHDLKKEDELKIKTTSKR